MFGTKVKSKPAGVLEQAITSTKEKRKRGTLDTEVVDLTDDVPEMKKAKGEALMCSVSVSLQRLT